MATNLYIENYAPSVKQGRGLKTKLPVTLSGTSATLAVGGTATVTGALAVTGITTLTGALAANGGITTTSTVGGRRVVVIEASSATPTLGASGSVNIATKGSATQTYTLPAATTAGNYYTFVCGHASGELLVNPQTGEKIVASVFATVGVDADTAVISNTTTGIKNTAATNAVSDNITLMADGVDTWYGIGISAGIWASQ